MNWLEKSIATISPGWAVKRAKAQREFNNLYQASQDDGRHRAPILGGNQSADNEVMIAGNTLREKARHLDQNDAYSTGALDGIVTDLIGRGITTEPRVRRKDGTPHTAVNEKIKQAYREWMRNPNYSGEYSGWKIQRLTYRSVFRDGECFTRFLEGKQYKHNTRFPLSIESIESEQCPLDYDRPTENIRQGVKKDRRRKPLAYYFYPEHPQDFIGHSHSNLIPVAAYNVLHTKLVKRINQTRGVTALHAVLDVVQDIWEIDLAERMAAKQGASIGLAIHRREFYDAATDNAGNIQERPPITEFFPGMVLDNLEVGEEAAMLSPNSRPNPMLVPFRDENLRQFATGLGTGYSRLARKYTGTYSSERQGLVDNWRLNEPNQQDSQDDLVDPMYQRFLAVSFTYNMIDIPLNEIDLSTLFDATHFSPTMPWIDPKKEVESMVALYQSTLESKSYLQRTRGRNPEDVRNEQAQDQELDKAQGISPNFGGEAKDEQEAEEEQP